MSVNQTDFDPLSHRHKNSEVGLVSDDNEKDKELDDFINDKEVDAVVDHFVGDNVDDDIKFDETDILSDDPEG